MSAAAACALVVFGAASPSAAKPVLSGGQAMSHVTSAAAVAGGSWGAGIEAALPANAPVTSDDVFIESVSCPSAGNCSAVGWYQDSTGKTEGLLLTETGGKWAAGVEAVLPANAGASPAYPGVLLRSVSCASAGNCSAVGTYVDSSGNQEGLLLTETAGSWSAGIEAALPANASNRYVDLGSVSCASAGNCAAVGSYNGPPGDNGDLHGLLLTETAGSWAIGVEATLPADAAAPQYQSVSLASVSCASPGNCSAVGTYISSDGQQQFASQGLLLTETAGRWAPGVEAALPADSAYRNAVLDSVSCASAGNCTAVGEYDVSIVYLSKFQQELRGNGLLLTETAGSWATGVEAAVPANADGTDALYSLGSVSCPSAGNCSAVGTYYDNSPGLQGLLLTETAGSWATGVEALPANAASIDPSRPGAVNSVSCASPGNCGAVATGGHLLTETAGSWATGVEPSLPANAGPGYSLVFSVSCGSAASCTAVGTYTDNSGRADGLLIGGSPAQVKLNVSKNGTGSGTVSATEIGVDCGSTCSASFDAGTSVTLTATPSAGSRFRGWSGGGCSGTGSCQVNTGISEQTVTATFNLLPKCVVPKLRGKTLKAAEHAVRTHNCRVGKITHAGSRTIKKGHVISQRPTPGRRLKHGARVNLVVSRGRR